MSSKKNDGQDEFFTDLSESLGKQVNDDLDYTEDGDFDYGEDDFYEEGEEGEEMPAKKKRTGLKIFGAVFAAIILFMVFIVATPPGRRLGISFVSKFVSKNLSAETGTETYTDPDTGDTVVIEGTNMSSPLLIKTDENGNELPHARREDYVTTFLIFGIEEIDGAANTDAIMLISINTKDDTIKLTSLLRDTYVDIPGYKSNKINSVYVKGVLAAGKEDPNAKAKGASLLVRVIEETYDIEISGYACVNFKSFESIIDRLGGIDIELGAKEASYLNSTNYISEPSNRCVKEGWNHLNGNQAMGYVRVRKCVTLGGANNDYGRTVRQRRVISAIINQYKSVGIQDMLPIMRDCLGKVYTSLTEEQITDVLCDVVENQIFTTNSLRLPYDGMFYDSSVEGVYNGSKKITYALVIDKEKNKEKLHQFVFLDPVPEEKDESTGSN